MARGGKEKNYVQNHFSFFEESGSDPRGERNQQLTTTYNSQLEIGHLTPDGTKRRRRSSQQGIPEASQKLSLEKHLQSKYPYIVYVDGEGSNLEISSLSWDAFLDLRYPLGQVNQFTDVAVLEVDDNKHYLFLPRTVMGGKQGSKSYLTELYIIQPNTKLFPNRANARCSTSVLLVVRVSSIFQDDNGKNKMYIRIVYPRSVPMSESEDSFYINAESDEFIVIMNKNIRLVFSKTESELPF